MPNSLIVYCNFHIILFLLKYFSNKINVVLDDKTIVVEALVSKFTIQLHFCTIGFVIGFLDCYSIPFCAS
jgi:hypothetical protein